MMGAKVINGLQGLSRNWPQFHHRIHVNLWMSSQFFYFENLQLTSVTVDIGHNQVLLIWDPEQRTDQRKVTKFIMDINSKVEITRFTQLDEWYNKQGNMIKFLEEYMLYQNTQI